MQLVIGSVVRAHGIRGEVVVAVTTDEPQERYVVGSVLATDPAAAGPLTIEGLRVHTSSGTDRLLVAFDGVEDRDAAERLRGVRLLVDAADVKPSDDPDEFHDFELIGLAVLVGGPGGERVGEIVRVDHGPGADMLIVARPDGRQSLVPFVTAIVPEVDVAAGHVMITPPEGLLDL
ncbi:MAG TPA: ribosome maturation factor RimM [Micromonosporaceae bacterium]|nr:ribosome maturation factor RimM [Micromonosporaceae bacterium]